jgi:hypothetical protein
MNKTTSLIENFKVAAISDNANSFGLYGVVILSKSGNAFEIGCNSLSKPKVRQTLKATLTESGYLENIEGLSYEIPRKLQKPPQAVIDEVFAKS